MNPADVKDAEEGQVQDLQKGDRFRPTSSHGSHDSHGSSASSLRKFADASLRGVAKLDKSFSAKLDESARRGKNKTRLMKASDMVDICNSVYDPIVRKDRIVKKHTYASLCGSCSAVFIFLVYFLLDILSAGYWSGEPASINENAKPTGSTIAVQLPQVGLTFSGYRESDFETFDELLKYVHPQFMMRTINHGFSTRRRSISSCQTFNPKSTALDGSNPGASNMTEKLFLDDLVVIGKSACGFKPNHPVEDWPTLCTSLDERFKIQGNFGDASWKFFEMKFYPCGEACGAAKAVCGNASNFWKDKRRIAFNLWFRFQVEDWTESSELPPPKYWEQKLYNKLDPDLRLDYVIYFTHNTAEVTPRRYISLPTALDPIRTEEWLTFDRIELEMRPRDADDEYLEVQFRLGQTRRHISVKYVSLRTVLSELGGSWPVSVIIGVLIAFTLHKAAGFAVSLDRRIAPPKSVAEREHADDLGSGSEPEKIQAREESEGEMTSKKIQSREEREEELAST